jgi:osmotically-inducible protein OsmY
MSCKTFGWAIAFTAVLAAGACERDPATTTDTMDHGAATPPGVADTAQTPDGLVTTTIQGKYAASDEVKGYRINVNTVEGVVTLNGTVDSPEHRAEAIRIARDTNGVRDVRDNLVVSVDRPAATTGSTASAAGDRARSEARQAGEAITDGWITTKVKSQFLVDDRVKGTAIDVTTKDGVVTVSGSVPTEAQKRAAEALIKETEGVKQVVNNIRVGK